MDDVVAVQRRHREERQVVHVELHGEGPELGLDLLEALLVPVDEVHLVDAHHEVRDAEQRRQERVTPRLLEHPLRASMRIRARSAVDAPVTMLRVYWMCPGVSAMMNFRFGVAK